MSKMILCRQLLAVTWPRKMIAGFLVLALLLCSLPITHSNHAADDHGHTHGHSHDALLLIDSSPTESEGQPSHQHIGVFEHNQMFAAGFGNQLHIFSSQQRWNLDGAADRAKDLIYGLYRPPRTAAPV